MMYFVFINILLTFISHISAKSCCHTSEVLLKGKDMCWNPKLNLSYPIIMTCNKTYRYKNFRILKDGRLSMKLGFDYYETYDQDLYCASNTTKITDKELKNISLVVLMCAGGPKIFDDRVLGYCMIISIVFLVPTALIYTVLSELRDIQGKSIINFCTSLAIAQGMLAMMKLVEYTDMTFCATAGFLTYFFILASFFWTNSIAMQILLNTRQTSTLDYSRKEFKWYFLYSWGCPTILTICVAAIVNFHPSNRSKSGIGLNNCWFLDEDQRWYYIYSIITFLLAVNICIFIYISIILWRKSFSSSHLRALNFKFVMTVRLILLMGLPWVFDMVGSLAGEHIVWYIIDIFNCLQGILIFLLLVVFRWRVVKLMHKHGWLNYISGYVEKYLAVKDDEETVVTMQHIDIPMTTMMRE